MGEDVGPIEITAAAITPVVAASSAPTKIVAEGEAAAQRSEHLSNRFQQILCHAAAFENDPHKGEKRNSQQRIVLHDAEYP